jgi:hypothetical protein
MRQTFSLGWVSAMEGVAMAARQRADEQAPIDHERLPARSSDRRGS